MVLLQQMIVLFILMGIGFFCGKKSFLSDEGSKTLSWVVVNVATPAMILSAGMNDESTVRGRELAIGFLVALLIYAFQILMSFVILPLIRVPAGDGGVYRVMTIFSNIGFMGLPILQAVYGQEAVLYGALFQFPFNFLMYTYGIAALRGENPFRNLKSINSIINVGVISTLLSVVIYVLEIPMPEFLKVSAGHLRNLAAPLSMLVIGQSLIHFKVKDMLEDLRLLVFSLIKLLVVPVVGMLIFRCFISDALILNVCFIMLATPIASMCAMMAQQYGGNYSLASKGVALSTVLSVVTIPLLSLVLQ
ncbi:MAG: AEC family transporter [Butyrivibrio sp.]|nr:AEC family transporter [Butyrivibrio sp.]